MTEESENKELNEFFNLSKDLMVIATKDGFFKRINPACIEILGYTPQEMMSKPYLSFIHPEDQEITKIAGETMRRDSVVDEAFLNRYIKKDGTIAWLSWKVTAKEEVIYAIARDVTEKKLEEDLYHQTQEQLNLALEGAHLGTWQIDFRTQKVKLNEIAQDIYGINKEEIDFNSFILEFVHPEDQERTLSAWESSIQNQTNYSTEFRIIKSDGEIKWVLVMGKVHYGRMNNPIRGIGILSDISNRKKEEEHAQMLATVVENSHAFISIVGLDLKTIFLNPAAKKNLKLSPEEKFNLELTDFIAKEYHPKIYKEILPEVREKGFWGGEVSLTNQQETIPVLLTIFSIALTSTEQPFAYGIVARDIRDVKEKEAEQLRINKRLEALAMDLRSALDARDTFISIASHELKTPLTSLKLQSQLSKKLVERVGINNMTPEQIQKMVDTPLIQANKLIKLINDILDISVINAGKLVIKKIPTNLSKLLEEILSSFKIQIANSKCVVTTEIEPDVVGEWDSYRIEQVVSNLISNALKYAPGKPILITLKKEGNEVVFSIKDQGPGIHKETQGRIFKRFERGVPSSGVSGLGLGLFLAKQIVEGHGGVISVISEPEQGAEFIVKLPLFKKGKISASQIVAESKKNNGEVNLN